MRQRRPGDIFCVCVCAWVVVHVCVRAAEQEGVQESAG